MTANTSADGEVGSYSWAITGNGTIVGSNTGSSVNVLAGASGSFNLTLVVARPDNLGGCTTAFSKTVTVDPSPDCDIIATTTPIRAGRSASFEGPPEMTTYAWTVSINGGPVQSVGGNDQTLTYSVPVNASTLVVGLMITNDQGCSSSCSRLFDATQIGECILGSQSGCPGDALTYTVGDPPTGPPVGSTFLWTVTGATIVGADDGRSVTVTSLVCGTFTVKVVITTDDVDSTCDGGGIFDDSTPPVIGNCPAGPIDLDCNPETLPSCESAKALVNVSDLCGGAPALVGPSLECIAGAVVVDGCSKSQSFTLTAVDQCGNRSADCVVTYTWKEDTTKPVFANLPVGGDLGCNPEVLPTCSTTVTASDLCDLDLTSAVACTPGEITDVGTCGKSQTFTYTVTDSCKNTQTATVTYTWKVDTTKPVFANLPAGGDLGCNPTPPTCSTTVTASDTCDLDLTSAVACTPGETTDVGTCGKSQTFTYTVTDSCNNTQTAEVTYTWKEDTTSPTWTYFPPDKNMICDDVGGCDTTVGNTGSATASDNCGPIAAPAYTDQTYGTGCPLRIERTWTVRDECGNSISRVQVIQCLPNSKVIVTDSSLCEYDMNPGTSCKDFRLLFTQDPQTYPKYKVTATNPGQTFYNLFYNGAPGSSVTFTITLPYPYVTQGANPVHAYNSVGVFPHAGGYPGGTGELSCLVPGQGFYVGSQKVVLTGYIPQAMGSTQDVIVTLNVPSTGFVYLNIHLDYGLKKSTGYTAYSVDGGTDASTADVVSAIPDQGKYPFSLSIGGVAIGTDSICNINVFKKLPGVGGLAGTQYTTSDGIVGTAPKGGCKAVLKDSKGLVLATGQTDADGWYFCEYKWTGKATIVYLTLTPPGGQPKTQAVTLKSNGFVQADFICP